MEEIGISTEVAGKFFPDSQKAVVAKRLGFAEALAAVPLEAKINAPIILVEQNLLPAEVSTNIPNYQIAKIKLVGKIRLLIYFCGKV